jgi:hypothetical protein
MNTNLDKIALDLYGKIQTRFSDIKMGDENAGVLSKKSDIPHARFFEFEYKENGVSLGTLAITLDEDDGIVLQISGDIANNKHEGAFKFIRSFRQFAKDRLINFDVQNIGKDNLDKRDYEFKSKPKEEPMEPMMESKLYGTTRMSYQDLGEAKLIVKHSQMINPDLPAGRTMHIESIYVENADGERFKYPFKHLNGARALAEHLKHGGNPYDPIGQHISSLSEELAQLRKFKGYVSRNANLSEAMGDITTKVMERIDAVKKEVAGLQRPAYYTQFAESFEAREDQMIPEEIMSDWIDRLTIRSFNEDLRTAFPYIFRLVDESSIPVKELSPEDMLGEDDKENTPHSHQAKTTLKHLKKASYGDKADAANIKPGVAGYRDRVAMLKRAEEEDNLNELRSEEKDEHGNVVRWKEEGEWTKKTGKEGRGKVTNLSDKARRETEKMKKKDEVEAFESFLDSIVNEDEEISQDGENTLFSPNKATQQAAIDKFNEIMKTELKGGPEGINVIDSLKGLIDEPKFLEKMKDIDPDLDARGVIQTELNTMAKEDPEVARLIPQLDFKGNGEIGGQELPPEAPPAPEAGAMPPAAPAPEAPPAPPEGAAPPAPPEGAAPPAPVAEGVDRKREGMLKVINKAKKAGAKLDTKLDLGHREMTLHDCIRESGLTAQECGFDDGDETGSGDPVKDMLKSISGFWNAEERNFTIGGTRCKTKIIKDFKDGMFKGATPEDVHKCVALIDKMDPSSNHNRDLGDIKRLAGVKQMGVVHHHHSPEVEVDEASEQDDFAKMMSQFKQMHPQADIGKMMQQVQNDPNAKITRSNTSSGTINGKSASYDDAMKQMPKISFGGHDFDMNQPDQMGDKIKGMMGGMMGKMQGQAPNQDVEFPGGKMNPQGMMKGMMDKFNMQESDELSNILKIAGVKK